MRELKTSNGHTEGVTTIPLVTKAKQSTQMKLKSSKTTCNFKHAVLLVIVCRLFKSIKAHNTPTYYSNANNRTGMNSNFFLGEVVLQYSIYVLIAQIRTTWVTNTYLFTYALTVKSKQTGLHKPNNQMVATFWSNRVKFSTSKSTTYVEIRKLAESKFWWYSVELSKLNAKVTYLDKYFQWTLKSSHKDICTTFVLRCRQKAKQIKAHSIKGECLRLTFWVLNRKQLYV